MERVNALGCASPLRLGRRLKTRIGIFPIAMESGGRWAARSRAHLSSFIEWCIQTPRKDWSADDHTYYNRSIRDALDSTSLALARFTARQLLGAAAKRGAAGGR